MFDIRSIQSDAARAPVSRADSGTNEVTFNNSRAFPVWLPLHETDVVNTVVALLLVRHQPVLRGENAECFLSEFAMPLACCPLLHRECFQETFEAYTTAT